MKKITIKAPFKMEDIPVVGEFIIHSAEEDLAAINHATTDIDQAWLDGLRVKCERVKKRVPPLTKTSELKEVTRRLYKRMDDLRTELNMLEVKLLRAEDTLSIGLKGFGLSAIRKKISVKDTEGLLFAMTGMLQQVDANRAALEAKGFTEEQRAWFSAEMAEIRRGNELQQRMIAGRNGLTAANVILINDFWDDVSELAKIGRLVFKHDRARRMSYTLRALRHEVGGDRRRKKKEVPGSKVPGSKVPSSKGQEAGEGADKV